MEIVIEGVSPLVDGTYDFVPNSMNGDEVRLIKTLTGLRPNEYADAFRQDDPDLTLAYAKVALDRAGKDAPRELLWGAASPLAKITMRFPELGAAVASPPAEGSSEEPNSTSDGTGESSDTGTANPENPPPPTGPPE